MAETRRLKERVRTTNADAEALRVARERVNEFTAEWASLAVGAQQTQPERDGLCKSYS